jgi:hypothetical protein
MNDFTKTFIAVFAAAALAAAAYVTRPVQQDAGGFTDQGQPLFEAFTDPAAARSLQVLSYDQERAAIVPFKVEFDGKRWVIPSHHGYPADATKKMADAASVFIGLSKEQVVSDRSADHESLGVLSPDDEKAPLQGRGTRVTIQGEGGAPLADIIVGKQAPATTGDQGAVVNRRYVRLPDKNRVYAVVFDKSFSTSFAEWVETDLLQAAGQRIDRYVVNRYKIDENTGTKQSAERITVVRGEGLDISLADPAAPKPTGGWTMNAEPGGAPGPEEALNTSKIEEAIGALRDLRIAGVRPKPTGLAKWFSGESKQVTESDVIDLQNRGFFLTRDGQFVANEGEVSAACADGVVYTLLFGEVLFGSAQELSSGSDPIKSETPKEGEDKPAGKEARYAFVRVTFDESMFPEVPKPAPPAAPAASTEPAPAQPVSEPAPGGAEPEQPAAPQAPSAQAPSAQAPSASAEAPKDPAQQAYEAAVAERARKIADGRKRAEGLRKRFADWYYVIDGEAFAKLRPTRADLVQPKQAAQDAPMSMPPGMPAGMTPGPSPMQAPGR